MDPWGACTGQRCALWDLEDFGADVRYWHKADTTTNGQMSAFGGTADIEELRPEVCF